MKRATFSFAFGVVAASLLFSSGSAFAHGRAGVNWSVSIGTPSPPVVYGAPPVVYSPAPGYSSPAPVYYAPAPVYVPAAPMAVYEAPVYPVYAAPPYYGASLNYSTPQYHHWHRRHHHRHD